MFPHTQVLIVRGSGDMKTQNKTTLTVFYNDDYINPSDIETRTKAKPIAELIEQGVVPGARLASPTMATREQLLQVHSEAYVDQIWGESDVLRGSILASTGGVLAAVNQAINDGASGSLSSGLHHAKHNRYDGFCYVNGLALAALHAIEYFTLQDVGILDLDAHCGGGTFELVGNNPQVRLSDVSVVGYDTWSSTDPRHFIKIVKSADQYLDEVKNSLEHLRGIDFLIYNAGMDPFEDGGGMRGITREILEERERLVAQWCIDTQTPALFVLAGGYTSSKLDLDGLAKLHIPTIKEFRRILSNK